MKSDARAPKTDAFAPYEALLEPGRGAVRWIGDRSARRTRPQSVFEHKDAADTVLADMLAPRKLNWFAEPRQ